MLEVEWYFHDFNKEALSLTMQTYNNRFRQQLRSFQHVSLRTYSVHFDLAKLGVVLSSTQQRMQKISEYHFLILTQLDILFHFLLNWLR